MTADDDDDDDDSKDREEDRRVKQMDVDEGDVSCKSQKSSLPAKRHQNSDSTFIDRFYDFVSRYFTSLSACTV